MGLLKNLQETPVIKQVLKVVKNKYILTTALFLIWIFFLDTNNLIVWYKDLKQLATQNREKAYYKNAIQQAEEKLKELASNKDSLEKFAREQYFFHQQDEDVYVVEDTE